MRGFLVASPIFVVLACNGLVTPPSGPGTEYPCGVNGVVCSQSKESAVCCPMNHICGCEPASGEPGSPESHLGGVCPGGFSRCTPGYCCYDGDDWPSFSSADAGETKLPAHRSLQFTITR